MATTYTLPAATTSSLGGVIVDGVTITVSGTGVISAASSGAFNSATLTGTTTIQHASEIITPLTGATGTVVHDFGSGGGVFYHTNIVSSFTANFTNMPLVINRSISITLILIQGANPYIPYAVSINGVSQNLYWNGGTQPSGYAGKKDFVTFNMVYTAASTWVIAAGLASYG
jgi:hypothetical protein